MAGFWDFGPLGVELKNNIKASWWKRFVHKKLNVTGLDGSIITSPKIWKASGHVDCFNDVMLECSKCHNRIRADHYLEDTLNIVAEGLSPEEINKIVKEKKKFIIENGERSLKPLMGLAMKELRGSVPGDKIHKALQKKIKELIK